MRISTFVYCVKQGIVNICRNILFSLASMATISACIFLFCLFFAIAANVRNAALTAQNTLGITVFFDESLDDEQIEALGEQIASWGEVREMDFTSAKEAWESFKEVYFQGDEELASSFEEDNPLAGSASYTIYLNDIEDQSQVVARLSAMDGVRKVNSSDTAAMGLSTAGKIVGILSFVMIAVLLGLFGALIPLGGMYVLYGRAVSYMTSHFQIVTDVFEPLPMGILFPYMSGVAMCLGVGIGFFVSFFTIRRHLRV